MWQEKGLYRHKLGGGLPACATMPAAQRKDQSAAWKACVPGNWEVGTGDWVGSSCETGVKYNSGDEITIELIPGLYVTC